MIIHGVTELTDLYAALIDAGVGPATRPYVVVGNDGGALDMDQGRIEGVVGVRKDFLTGDALEERVPASEFSADAAQAFDAVIILALAAEQAGSLEPTDIAAQLPAVTTDGEQCSSLADCTALIGSATDIDYVGPGGPYEMSSRTGRPSAGYYRVSTVGETGFALGRRIGS